MFYGRALASGILFLSFLPITSFANISPSTAKAGVRLTGLYLQPASNNLKYAVFVAGTQPYSQSWHNQIIDPGYSPAFQLGFDYWIPNTNYNFSLDWLHLNTNDSDSKQASETLDPATIQFVAPPYDVGPAVFGIKRAESSVNFNFNNVTLNLNKTFFYNPYLTFKVFGGIQVLRIYQNVKTTFNDYAGAVPVPTQAYGLPADPNFYFQTENISRYVGAGPDMGASFALEIGRGFGITGDFLGTLTAGTIQAQDSFISDSTRLRLLGLAPSRQEITVPDETQVVPGFDTKLGLFYNTSWSNSFALAIEAGYRLAYYFNAISSVYPDTLVQPGENFSIPEFATGTMAINSTTTSNSPFSMQGPYVTVALDIV